MTKLIDILKEKGLEDETAQAVLDAMAEAKIFTAGEENLDKRYSKLKEESETSIKAKDGEITAANELIAELKKATKGSEEMQTKIADYEAKIAELTAENTAIRIDAALNELLRDNGALPESIEFLSFKVKAKGEIKLTEEGKVEKGEDFIAELKTQQPTQFVSEGEGDKTGKVYDPKKLKDGDSSEGLTREEFEKKTYTEQVKYKQEHPEAYKELVGD